jgi:hypothetical protein
MTGRIAHLVSACTVLQTTAAFVLPQTGSVKNEMELKFKNSYLEILESYKPRQRPTAMGNQFRTVPRPYYQSNSGISSGEYEQQSVKGQPEASSSSSLYSSFPSASSSSDYGQNNVYWSDINGFPPLQDQAHPSSRDMSISGTLDFPPQRSFDQSRYSQDRNRYDSSSSDRSFYDIPFKSNDMYARQFDSEERRRHNDRRPDGRHSPEGRRDDDRREPYDNRGRDMSGTGWYPPVERWDFPSMMDDIRPPPPPPPMPEWARPHESMMMMDPRSEEWGYGPPPHESMMMMDPRSEERGYGPPPHKSMMMMDPRSEEWGYGPPPNMPPPPFYGHEEFYYNDMPPPPPMNMERPPFGDQHWG